MVLATPWYRRASRADRLVPSERGIECFKESRVAERLKEAFHRALFDQALANDHVSISGNEDEWNRLSPSCQFPLKIRSGHSRHSDVEEQASGLVNEVGCEELVRRRERAGCKTELLQQFR